MVFYHEFTAWKEVIAISKVIKISDRDIVSILSENNPELLKNTFSDIEKELREEAANAIYHPDKYQEYTHLIQDLKELLKPLDGSVVLLTDLKEKALSYHLMITVPSDVWMYDTDWGRFIETLSKFSACRWEGSEEEIELDLVYTGIYTEPE